MDLKLLIGNDQVVEVTGLKNRVNGAFINNATVTARIKTLAGVDVLGDVWPVALPYVAASDGIYRGGFEDAVQLQENHKYIVEIRADDGLGTIAFWRFQVPARYRVPSDT